jgi:hypothetical protein
LIIFANIWFAFCLAALLGFTFRLYWHAYFTVDDFNNLALAQRYSGSNILRNVVDPTVRDFRPVGMAFYWMLQHCCDIDPLPYHAVGWLLHAVNVGLLFIVIRRIIDSGYAAAVGAALFAFQEIFREIYWNFGTIFELLSTALVLAAFYIHIRFRPSVYKILLIAVIYVLAIKAKEMAITLPIILALYEILRPAEASPRRDRNSIAWSGAGLSVLFLIGGWFVLNGVSYGQTLPPQDPYYMAFSPAQTVRGYGWYLDTLLHTHVASWVYIGMVAAILCYIVWQRDRRAAFFFLYALVALLPVIPLVNHRAAFYWYLPFLGLAGLAALATQGVAGKLEPRLGPDVSLIAAMVLFAAFCREQYVVQRRLGAGARIYLANRDQERRNFVQGLRTLPAPQRNETLYFASIPRDFDGEVLLTATQVALRRTDVQAKLVDAFPPGAPYRLRFDDGALERTP